jgi:hypothetical protein
MIQSPNEGDGHSQVMGVFVVANFTKKRRWTALKKTLVYGPHAFLLLVVALCFLAKELNF